MSYSDSLVKVNKSLVCVGLDPQFHPKAITEGFVQQEGHGTTQKEREATAAYSYMSSIVDATKGIVGVYKPNAAFWFRLGEHGIAQLGRLIDHIHAHKKLVILDIKTSDIGNTMRAYGEAYLEDNRLFSGSAVDAITVLPHFGDDSVLARDRGHSPLEFPGKGLYFVIRSSNPSGVQFQGQRLANHNHLYEEYAKGLLVWDQRLSTSVGAVIGGTSWDTSSNELSELQTTSKILAGPGSLPPILIPGVGAQGGTATEVVKTLVMGLRSLGWDDERITQELLKVVINSSRGINYAWADTEQAQGIDIDQIKEASKSTTKDLSEEIALALASLIG